MALGCLVTKDLKGEEEEIGLIDMQPFTSPIASRLESGEPLLGNLQDQKLDLLIIKINHMIQKPANSCQ